MATQKLNNNTNFIAMNLQNTSDERYKRRCSCRSWIKHWRNQTASNRQRCCVVGCKDIATHGAHVQLKDKRGSGQWWIAPFCPGCNNPKNRDLMYLERSVTLVAIFPLDSCTSVDPKS